MSKKHNSINEARFVGRVVGEPNFIATHNGGEVAWLNLSTFVREMSPNEQFTDVEEIVPILVTNPKYVEVVKKYVTDDKQLYLECFYKSWEANGQTFHGLVVKNISLWASPRNQNAGAGNPGDGSAPPM
jgi:hypothetical protein